jgi:hypothetical protein
MASTLGLGKRETVPAKLPDHGPEFNPAVNFGEVCGMEGVRYVQGKALFNNVKRYVGPAPESMWLMPLTAEQERERQKKIIANKKFFGAATAAPKGAAVPQNILDAERENRKALAAESRAA